MRPTGSKMALLSRCGWWARPEVPAPPKATDADSDAIRRGRDFAKCVETGADSTDPEVQGWLDAWRAHPLAALEWKHEQAFAYDWQHDTARRLDTTSRDYSGLFDAEIPGTPDIHRFADGVLTVVDHKSGFQATNEHGDSTAALAQLRGYALTLARFYGANEAEILIAYVSDEVRIVRERLDEFQIDALAAETFDVMAHVPTSTPRPGSHCGRCPAVGVCPASDAAAQALTLAPTLDLANMTPEIAGKLWQRIALVEASVEQVKKAVKARVSEWGFAPLPDGRVVRRVLVDRETISLADVNMAAGLAALSGAGLDPSKVVETKATTSFAAIERELKAAGVRGKELRGRMDALREDMRAAGVVKGTTIETYREGDAK